MPKPTKRITLEKEFRFLKSGIKFLKSLKKKDSVFVVSHGDGDGIASAALIASYLSEKRIINKVKFFHRIKENEFIEKINLFLRSFQANSLIILDLNIPESICFDLIKKGFKIMIIDHHIFELLPKEIVYINPKGMPTTTKPCASALTYRIVKEAGLKQDLFWVALLGSAADIILGHSLSVMKMTKFQEQVYYWGGQLDLRFNDIISVLNVGYYFEELNDRVFELLMESIKENEPLFIWLEKKRKARHIFDVLDQVDEEARHLIRNAEKIIEDKKKKLLVLKVNAGFRVRRILAEVLKLSKPHYTIFVLREGNNNSLEVSARSNVLPVNEILIKATQGMNDVTAGGHKAAGGAVIPKEFESKFIENIKTII